MIGTQYFAGRTRIPDMQINSDNEVAKRAIGAIVDLIVAEGGQIDSALRIECVNDELSVRVRPSAGSGKIVIKVPVELLVPAEPLNLRICNNQFLIRPDRNHLSSKQIDLAGWMLELFNATGKAVAQKETCPWIAYRQAKELLDAVLASRTSTKYLQERSGFLHENPNAPNLDEFVCDSFISSRAIRHEYDEANGSHIVFMPIIDWLNHDSRAFDILVSPSTDPKKYLQVASYQGIGNGAECFVNYGSYDCVDTFLNYGFTPEWVGFVRSIPLEVELDGIGKLIVNSIPGFKNKNPLHSSLEDIRNYVPVGSSDAEENLVLSHLLIPGIRNPHALRRVLQAIVTAYAGQRVPEETVLKGVREVERAVLDENIDFYEKLQTRICNDQVWPAKLCAPINAIASSHLNILKNYAFD
jgi:hypothetical protein